MVNPELAALEELVIGAVAVTEGAIAVAGSDLTFVQWRVIMIVGERSDGETIGEIAGRLGARVSPASRLISRLRRRGVVRTDKDPSDARVTRVQLTESGDALRTRVLVARRERLSAAIAEVGLDPESASAIRSLARALERHA